MTIDEIRELMRLRNWTKTKLAAELDLSENAVHRWLAEDRQPTGPAAILMRQWLDASRKEAAAVPA